MRSAASCCQLLQEIWFPRGAFSGVYPAWVSVSVGITDDGNGMVAGMATAYQVEYCVPSLAIPCAALCTSLIPGAVWSALISESSSTTTQSNLRVTGSIG